MKKGGRLIIVVPNENSFLKYVTNSVLNMPPHHVTRWSNVTFEYIASKYELDIETIYHEKVQDVHKRLYLHTLVFNSLYGYKLISTSIFTMVVSKLSSLLSKLLERFKK